MFKSEITFDRFIRGLSGLATVAVCIFVLNYLSSVLLPFFVAWLLAYMLDPVVSFMQHKLRLRHRVLCVILTFLLLMCVGFMAFSLLIPPIVAEVAHFKQVATLYLERGAANSTIPAAIEEFIHNNFSTIETARLWENKELSSLLQEGLFQAWTLLGQTANLVLNVFASLIALFYLFFILADYDNLRQSWSRFVPEGQREFVTTLVSDVERGMQGYFRGQALVALCVGILFSVGFLIIDFPLAIVLGLFIGALNLVPYLQIVGFVPTLFLALLKAADTGENFWVIIGGALIVFAVVQIIQDTIITPRVMGKIMGLSPTVILLSLSVWGYVLGFIGLIIALPLTTLIISYYKRYVVKA